MNQRLNEIYRSCRPKEALASQDQYQSADVLIGTEVQKFAELIVKECAELAGCNGHVSGFGLGDLIKEHFGVEQ